MTAWGKRADMIVHESDPYNAESSRTALAECDLTPVDAFYSRNHGPVPVIDPDAWRLTVDGLVEAPLTLSLHDLQTRFTDHELAATLQCAGNRRAGFLAVRDIPDEAPWGPGATSSARWTGVRLADVLAAAGPTALAAHVAFEAPDVSELARPPQVYGSSIPLDKARRSEVLLAWGMNGTALPLLHGAPVRVVVPGYIGARSVKWVERITVQTEPSDNYFQATAYRLLPPDADPETSGPGAGLSLGAVALNADVLSPDGSRPIPAGPTAVSGYAFAGEHRSVARVDVSTDGGRTWLQADLDPPASAWTWRRWHCVLTLDPGRHDIVVRAWDSSGAAQPEDPGPLWNPKGYINNAWARLSLTVQGS